MLDEQKQLAEEEKINRLQAVDEYIKPKKVETISIRVSRNLKNSIDFALNSSDCDNAAEFIRVAIAKELAAISVADRVQDSLSEIINGNVYTRNHIEDSVEKSNKTTEKLISGFLKILNERDAKLIQIIQKRDNEFREIIEKRDQEFMQITKSLLSIVEYLNE